MQQERSITSDHPDCIMKMAILAGKSECHGAKGRPSVIDGIPIGVIRFSTAEGPTGIYRPSNLYLYFLSISPIY
jgi:hypothetical protein